MLLTCISIKITPTKRTIKTPTNDTSKMLVICLDGKNLLSASALVVSHGAGTQTKTIPVQPVKIYSPTFFKDRTVNTFAGYVHASFVSQSKLFDQSDSADRWQRLMLSPATDLSLFFASCC